MQFIFVVWTRDVKGTGCYGRAGQNYFFCGTGLGFSSGKFWGSFWGIFYWELLL